MSFARTDKRLADELRPVRITPGFLPYAEGSALIEMGETEYSMLPRSTLQRTSRETGRGGPSGRTHEIQRLIGRSLRAVFNTSLLGERTITLDCDVLQADGGTRTASITGAYVACALACRRLLRTNKIERSPLTGEVAAISVGIVGGTPLLDLKYDEDSRAEVDMNVICTGDGAPFTREEMDQLLELARQGIGHLIKAQRAALEQAGP